MTIDGQDPISADQLAIDGDRANRRNFMKKVAVGGAVVWASPAITSSLTAAAAASAFIPGIGGTSGGTTISQGAASVFFRSVAGANNRTASGSGMLIATNKTSNGGSTQTFSMNIVSSPVVTKVVFTITGGADETNESMVVSATGGSVTSTTVGNVVTYTITGASITAIQFVHGQSGNGTGTETAVVSQYTVTT